RTVHHPAVRGIGHAFHSEDGGEKEEGAGEPGHARDIGREEASVTLAGGPRALLQDGSTRAGAAWAPAFAGALPDFVSPPRSQESLKCGHFAGGSSSPEGIFQP